MPSKKTTLLTFTSTSVKNELIQELKTLKGCFEERGNNIYEKFTVKHYNF